MVYPLSGHPSAASRAQDRESSPAKNRHSSTMPLNIQHDMWTLTLLQPHPTIAIAQPLELLHHSLPSHNPAHDSVLYRGLDFHADVKVTSRKNVTLSSKDYRVWLLSDSPAIIWCDSMMGLLSQPLTSGLLQLQKPVSETIVTCEVGC